MTRNGLTHPRDPAHWPAPSAHGSPVSGTVAVPGSKSLTNRYLVLAALASGASVVRKPLHSRDSALMVTALEQLGAAVTELPDPGPFGPDLRIDPVSPGAVLDGPVTVDCGLAGTVMRFVPPWPPCARARSSSTATTPPGCVPWLPWSRGCGSSVSGSRTVVGAPCR